MVDRKPACDKEKFDVGEQASYGRLCYYMPLHYLHTQKLSILKALGNKYLCEMNYAKSILCCLRLLTFLLIPSTLSCWISSFYRVVLFFQHS